MEETSAAFVKLGQGGGEIITLECEGQQGRIPLEWRSPSRPWQPLCFSSFLPLTRCDGTMDNGRHTIPTEETGQCS